MNAVGSARASGASAARRVLRDPSTLLLVAQLVTAGSALVANVLAARALGPSGRGELALLLQIGYFASLAVLLGCERSVVAVYTGRSPRTVVRGVLRLLARPAAVDLLVVAAILSLPLATLESWRTRLVVAAVFMLVNALNVALRSVAIAARRPRGYLAYGVTGEVLRLGGFAALAMREHSTSTQWLLVYVAAGALSAGAWTWWWGRSAAGQGEHATAGPDHDADRAEKERFHSARREGLRLLPGTIAHSGTLRVDRLILAALASTAALGLYASVATVVELITWPLIVFADSRLGLWRAAHDRGTLSLRRVMVAAVAFSVVAGTFVAIALRLLIVPVLGPDFAAALPLVVPLTIASAVFGISQVLITALTAVRRGGLSSVVEVVGLAVSVTAYVVLIARYGALGAAYGSLIGYATCLVLAALLLARVRRPAAAVAPPSGEPRREVVG